MNAYILRVNCAHLKDTLLEDYLPTLEHMHKCVIASLCTLEWEGFNLPPLCFENTYYQSLYSKTLLLCSLSKCMRDLALDKRPYQMLECHPYFVEFFTTKLAKDKNNYLTVTFDSAYHLVLNLKQI